MIYFSKDLGFLKNELKNKFTKKSHTIGKFLQII